VYFVQRGSAVVVILCGGDKKTQAGDIKRAIKIAADWKE
jgi:putative addiction module killer protein